MYLHINKNCVIKNDSIIGIFSIDDIEKVRESAENIEDYSEGTPKSFVLTEENGKTKIYITKLNVDTLKKRKI